MTLPEVPPTQKVLLPELHRAGVSLYVRREDLLHPVISGNKFRKLSYNLRAAKEGGHDNLLTFGGAYSNHIAATARAGREYGFRTIGIIRGDELERASQLNPTLTRAKEDGMELRFISRAEYRLKEMSSFLAGLREEYGRYYLLPEGGTNDLAVKGCEDILGPGDLHYDTICCSVGTGGTLAGLINASSDRQQLIGFSALKGLFMQKDICSFVRKDNWCLKADYHFGGYAKINVELIAFINSFQQKTGIPLDPVYTGKMFFGLMDMIGRRNFNPGSAILAIHSGGLQGKPGMNQVLKRKKLPLIDL